MLNRDVAHRRARSASHGGDPRACCWSQGSEGGGVRAALWAAALGENRASDGACASGAHPRKSRGPGGGCSSASSRAWHRGSDSAYGGNHGIDQLVPSERMQERIAEQFALSPVPQTTEENEVGVQPVSAERMQERDGVFIVPQIMEEIVQVGAVFKSIPQVQVSGRVVA